MTQEPTPVAARYAAALTEKFAETKYGGKTYSTTAGQVYDRITETRNLHQYDMSVHAFVVRATGDLVKADGWKAPAKSKRHPSGLMVKFNLATEEGFQEAIAAADEFGGYLYSYR